MKKRIFVLIILSVYAVLMLSGCARMAPASALSSSRFSTLIIDAGHGGADGGAVAKDGSKESEINLAVAQKLEALSGLFGIPSIMTRTSEELDYPQGADSIRAKKVADQKARVELINSTPNAILISIHQNLYPSPSPSGAQALYAKTQGSKELAEMIQSSLIFCLDADNKRVASQISNDIYLMKSVDCPAVLIECGFISNPAELALLKDSEYQRKIASIIISSYIQFNSETGNSYGQS
ncbi:MAG: N-acetylmuramoyl-L-alanine amidase [Clostridiales bacterium]|nr:N-acetylmuramoyl-L-alanine amidase [Clostridiales bacterium]